MVTQVVFDRSLKTASLPRACSKQIAANLNTNFSYFSVVGNSDTKRLAVGSSCD